MSQSLLWQKKLTAVALRDMACEFVKTPIWVGPIRGPIFGEVIEKRLVEFLEGSDYVICKKRTCDFEDIKVDLKTMQFEGARGGSAKIHGYSKDGPPEYSILLLGYQYQEETICFVGVFWIPSREITWVHANHYLFSVPDDGLEQYRVNES